eukprot:jgi/Chlat1/9209/Chrsp97S08408
MGNPACCGCLSSSEAAPPASQPTVTATAAASSAAATAAKPVAVASASATAVKPALTAATVPTTVPPVPEPAFTKAETTSSRKMASAPPKIYIIYHSIWGINFSYALSSCHALSACWLDNIFLLQHIAGHIRTMAHKVAEGVREAGGDVKIFQVPETLPQEVLEKMHSAPRGDDPTITTEQLTEADAFLWGIPTRYGMMSAQFKSLIDSTGQLWQQGALVGKPVGIFFCTSSQGGGQETTALTAVTQIAHHGMIFVPMGYTTPEVFNMDEIHGGSAYGAGSYTTPAGTRMPTELELAICKHQGSSFTKTAAALKRGRELA